MYYHQEGKKTIGGLSSSSSGSIAQNGYTYNLLNGDTTPNIDVDQWSAQVSLSSYTYSSLFAGKKVQFGVRSVPMVNGLDPSDITWSEYLEF